jgi:pantothenate synthetase
MGALHAGHGALIERARRHCGTVVVSIFVNPIQFERRDDYEAYVIDLEKDFDPANFRAVATVVAKLFNIVSPDRAYLGEKDAQQLAIVQRMVRELNMNIEIVPAPTVREADGPALSSRNRQLCAHEPAIAPAIYKALKLTADAIHQGCTFSEQVRAAALARLIDNIPV